MENSIIETENSRSNAACNERIRKLRELKDFSKKCMELRLRELEMETDKEEG